MVPSNDIRYERSQLGVEHCIGIFEVTRDMIIDFARSTGETAPIFAGGPDCDEEVVAPPTFCNLLTSKISRPDIKLEFGDTGFFAGQGIELMDHIRPGDVLEGRTKLKDVYAKTGRSGKMVFAVWETSFSNQHGRTVALVRDSFVRRNRGS
mgnify:CR=1 FL=1